jgi:hypothetical protein
MRLNPAGVKDRQFFRATFAANRARPDYVIAPSRWHAAIPTLVKNCEAKRIPPGNRYIETLELSGVS